jgi:hypothetical protein
MSKILGLRVLGFLELRFSGLGCQLKVIGCTHWVPVIDFRVQVVGFGI